MCFFCECLRNALTEGCEYFSKKPDSVESNKTMLRQNYIFVRTNLAPIYSLEEKCLDIGPVEASLSRTIFKQLLGQYAEILA